MPIPVDLTDLPMDVRQSLKAVLTNEHAAEIVQARIRQQQIAKFYHQNKPRAIEGLGAHEMAVDPFWIGYWNMKMGRQVWADPDFRKWLCREDEAFKVRSGGTGKIQVGYMPTSASFHKAYADR